MLRSDAWGAVGCAQGAKRPERGAPSRGPAPRGGAALEPVKKLLTNLPITKAQAIA